MPVAPAWPYNAPMSRVLVVAASRRTRETVSRLLRADGHETMEADNAERVLFWLTHEVVDLVIADLDPPEMTAAALRNSVKRGLSPRDVPFIFMRSGDAHGDVLQQLAATGDLFLLGEPINYHLLMWLVRSITSNHRQIQGTFAEGSLVRLFEHIDRNRDSGVLIVQRDTVVRKLVFVDGRLVSNDADEVLDMFLWTTGSWAYERGRTPRRDIVSPGLDLKVILAQRRSPHPPRMNPDEDDVDHSITLDPAAGRRRTTTRAQQGAVLGRMHVVRLEIPVRELLDSSLPSSEVFLLSRLAAGEMNVGRLMDACPMDEDQVLEILDRAISRGVVVIRKPG